ncbi:MAG: PhoH family protein [Candidatus Omnitrophota bacterium]
MVEPDLIKDYLDRGVIEVAPLAYMRGRTLNDSFIIMDEAQNSTREQMKMFLTRLGFDSKTVITGDVTQSDLPGTKRSGLIHAGTLLEKVEGIKVITMKSKDVVRHELVQKIIEVYKRESEKEDEGIA